MPKGIAKIFVACVTISVVILICVLTSVAAIWILQLAVELSIYGKAFVILFASGSYVLLGMNLLMKE